MMKSVVAWSLFNALVSALVFDAPAATPVWGGFEIQQGLAPIPTEAPSLVELEKRQQVQGLIVAPDGTCGYISGASASPFGLCCSTCSCGFATTAGHYGAFYCCNSATCESRVPTTCIDARRFTASSACDSKCAADPVTMKCTAAPYVYCNLAEFETVNVQALFCDSVTVSHTQSIYTTYAGEIGRVLTPWQAAAKSSTATSSPAAASSSTTTLSPTPTPSATNPSAYIPDSTPVPSASVSNSSPPSASSTVIPAGQGQTTSSTTPSQSATQTSAPASSPPIGGIVGGVVGGIAGIALVGAAIFFCLRRRSNSNNDPAAPGGTGAHQPPVQPAGFAVAGEKIPAQVQENPAYPVKPADNMSQVHSQAYGGYYAGQQQPQGPYPQPQPQQYPPVDNRYSQVPYGAPPQAPHHDIAAAYDAGGYGNQPQSNAPQQPQYGAQQPYGQQPTYYGGSSSYVSHQTSPAGGAAELHSTNPQSPTPTYSSSVPVHPGHLSSGGMSDPSTGEPRFEVHG